MKKIIIGSLFVILLILSFVFRKEIQSIALVYTGNLLYSNGHFRIAYGLYDGVDASNLSKRDSEKLFYDKGVALMNLGRFEDALAQFKMIDKNTLGDSDLNFLLNFMQGSAKEKIGDEIAERNSVKMTANECQELLALWKDAQLYYGFSKNSKSAFDHKELDKRLEDVAVKIAGLQTTCEQQDGSTSGESRQQDNQKQNGGSSGQQDQPPGKDPKQGDKEGGEEKNPGGSVQTPDRTYQNLGGQDPESLKMNPQEKKELDEYSRSLKRFQQDNQQHLRRGPQSDRKNPYDDLMKKFSSDPFFRDTLPDDESGKDW